MTPEIMLKTTVREYLQALSKIAKKASKSDDIRLMEAVIVNIVATAETYLQGIEEFRNDKS